MFKESDIESSFEIIHDEKLCKYISFPNLTIDDELEYIRKCVSEADESKYEKWSIVLKDTNITIGNISVNTINKKHNYCNVGYVIRYDYLVLNFIAKLNNLLINNFGRMIV